MPTITLSQVEKRFGQEIAVTAMDITIGEGEFFSLVGPSGCGKTTIMRMIGGLETPSAGKISIGNNEVFDASAGIMTPPATRGVGMVFQSYALWPHMTVRANVGFGLDVRGIKGTKAAEKVAETLEKLQIGHLAERYPAELSGGQQQRVALARELIVGAKVLLLDEPLSNLDAKLRMEMRAELRRLHAESKATFIYVTHDQMEALTLSTRMAVMRDGVIQQIGTPREIFEAPVNLFVAEFLSIHRLNVMQGEIRGGKAVVPSGEIAFDCIENAQQGIKVKVGLRPEDLRLKDSGGITCTVDVSFVAGSMTLTTLLTADGNEILVVEPFQNEMLPGVRVDVICDPASVLLFDAINEALIN